MTARRGRAVRRGAAAQRGTAARRGMTLVEVIIALGLAITLLATVFVFVQDLVRARDRIERTAMRERAMDAFLDALELALASSTLEAGDGGIAGDALHCTIASASSDPARAMGGGASPFPAAVTSVFAFEESDGSLRLRRGDGADEALPAELVALRFRYHDGTEWLDEYDGRRRGRLPAAIEISMWTDPWPEGQRPSWLPEPATIEEESTPGPEGSLAAFRAPAPRRSEGRDADDGSAPPSSPDATAAGAALDRELVDAPAPERRRVITVPDSAPPALQPMPSGARP